MSRTKHRAELLYRYLIIATKRLTDRQLMILLAIVVGLAAGLATYVFQHTLEFFRFSLTSWFDIDKASVLYFFYPSSASSSRHCSCGTSSATTSARASRACCTR